MEGTGFEIRSTDPSFLDRIRPHLAGYEATEAELADVATYLFSVIPGEDRRLPGGMVARGLHSVYAQGMRIYHGPDPEATVGSLLHMMRSLALDYLDEFVRIRGGSVAVNGGGLLLATAEDRPETAALVAMLLRRGAAYLGDEISLIDPVLRRLHPSPLPVLVDVAAASLVPGIGPPGAPPRSRRATPGRYAASPGGLGSRRGDPTPLKWIAFPSFEPGAPTRLEPAGGADAVFALSRACANLDVWEDRGLMMFRELAEGAAISRLVIGSLEEAADLLIESAPALSGT
ncbi:MAG: hypothetical protein ACRDIZ_00450 [Actinomycetota bacterium]